MKTKFIIFGLLSVLILSSCNNNKNDVLIQEYAKNRANQKETSKSSEHTAHKVQWDYSGEVDPRHWAELIKDSDCGGKLQSPINIITVDAVVDNKLKPLEIHYDEGTKIYEVVNNGHSIQYNFKKGDYITYEGHKFELKQIHFHESAEHTINGIRYPMAIHMVHTNDKGEFLVLAVMAKEGIDSKPFKFLERYLPLKKGEVKTINTSFDLSQNLPKDRSYYSYTGSLTTPPCTEGVHWIVFKESITVSLEQVLVLRDLMPLDNFRNEQPLEGRIVKMTAY